MNCYNTIIRRLQRENLLGSPKIEIKVKESRFIKRIAFYLCLQFIEKFKGEKGISNQPQ